MLSRTPSAVRVRRLTEELRFDRPDPRFAELSTVLSGLKGTDVRWAVFCVILRGTELAKTAAAPR